MKKMRACIICALFCAAALVSCSKAGQGDAPNRRVVLFYAAAFNNLSASILQNIDTFFEGKMPAVGNNDVFLVYAHTPFRYGVYVKPTNPVLFRAYIGADGKLRRDTLIVYPDTDVSGSAETLNKVMSDVQNSFPAQSYGLIISSHGRGWLPPGYEESSTMSFKYDTKEICMESPRLKGIDILDFPGAIPMHLDFMILDACLMGCVEVAYELKDKCDMLLFSPTEILSYGMDYKTMASRLLNCAKPDLIGIAKDFYELYQSQSGIFQSATVSLVDCKQLGQLADAFRDIVSHHREGLENTDRNSVQAYFYNDYHWFYDLRDLLEKAGATADEMRRLDATLDACVIYKAATEKFFDLKLENVCGLSVYFPFPGAEELNNYYKTLAWNEATGLIQ